MKTRILIPLIVVLASCSGNSRSSAVSGEQGSSAPAAAMDMSAKAAPLPANAEPVVPAGKEPVMYDSVTPLNRKLIREADISYESKNLSQSLKTVREKVRSMGGYISGESQEKYDNRVEAFLTIRIPVYNFDRFAENIENGVEYEKKSISSKDVTEEYTDVEIRIKNRKLVLEQYRALLARATKMEDIINIESYIGNITSEIESAEGQLRYLGNQTQYSTVRLTVYEKRSGSGWGRKLGNALAAGWTGVSYFILMIATLWPLWIIGALLFLLIRRMVRGKKPKQM